ncbi:type I-D CRISPR-associated helicase Cas3' [Methylacidiphilum caldifontis]|uniref:type I-D CRISPR-associated helicase Cas3' n=1 Tax=Methylacidiphilum caldifontis TaxID=2795386 RepID=UPI001A8C6E0C|nr:type I-D CRISPR-associated helicase Cas3' [Methylacidiphilum caldifontis]QSR87922.1 type I-D CRISPR-associated helicase Cas3' [Methylacidiphilum caldifontis]
MSIEIDLLPHFEPLASDNPFNDKLPYLLDHQLETFNSVKDNDLIFNLSTTGTGKTLAALLGLLNFPTSNALIIAPTNALVSQHKRDAEDFKKKFNLSHIVVELTKEKLEDIDIDAQRAAEKIYRLLSNPISILEEKPVEKKPFILVTNPDIFYYSIFYLFNSLDKRNVAQEFMIDFNYIIIDEFHYYNAKQFANFLYFIILSYKFGFFEKQNRKIVILTATPDLQFREFICKLKKLNIRIKEIEPKVFPGKPSTPVLSELVLNLFPLQKLSDFPRKIEYFLDLIKQNIREDKDGLIISSSLRNINIIAKNLNSSSIKDRYARITGPINREEREKASFKPLILATPTVDIGYNFVGRQKERQNIDFGYFDAKYIDQFWQRLGRIGRVLGKPIHNEVSYAYAFIPEEAYLLIQQKLNSYNYKRNEFKQSFEEQLNGLMRRDLNTEYISYFSLLEVMLPIKNILEITPNDLKDFIEETFETIKHVYSPKSKRSFRSLYNEIKEFQNIKKVLKDLEITPCQLKNNESQTLLQEKYGTNFTIAKQLIENGDNEIKKEFMFFLRNKIAKYDAMFKFRDNQIDISVSVYDPYSLISESKDYVLLDFLHLIRNFDFELFDDKNDAFKKTRREPPEAELYVIAKDILPQPRIIRIAYSLPEYMNFEDYDNELVGDFISLNNLMILGFKKDFKGEDLVPLPREISMAIYDKFVTGIILPKNFNPSIIYKCINNEFYPFELEVTSNGKSKLYLFFMGIDAHKFFSKYGWSLKKLNSTVFIA